MRLGKLATEGSAAPSPSPVDPRLFIEESGKTTVTQLTDVRRTEATTKLSAGDQLQLERRGNQLGVTDLSGQDIGRIEPKLEQDLVKLLGLGNQYAVFVTAVNDQVVHVIIRETRRSAAMGNRPSFRPSAAAEGGVRAYTREGVLRYELEEEEEGVGEVEYVSDLDGEEEDLNDIEDWLEDGSADEEDDEESNEESEEGGDDDEESQKERVPGPKRKRAVPPPKPRKRAARIEIEYETEGPAKETVLA